MLSWYAGGLLSFGALGAWKAWKAFEMKVWDGCVDIFSCWLGISWLEDRMLGEV